MSSDWHSSDRHHHYDEGENYPPIELPSLPGFRPNYPPSSQSATTKSQSLSFVNGKISHSHDNQNGSSHTLTTDSLSVHAGYMTVQSPPLQSGRQNNHLSPNSCHRQLMTGALPSQSTKEVLDPTDVSGRYSFFRKQADRENGNIALPFCPESKLPSFIEHDRRVLLFKAYYEEDVLQSAIEEQRVHTCELYFYVEDETMEIIETKQENSGIVQGRYLSRSRVAKPGSQTSFYEIDDLKIGRQVVIYSRTFHIASCNESTREYVLQYHNWDVEDVEPLPLPRDMFAEANRAKMRREIGVPGVDRKRKMNDLKQVMESMLGKASSMTDRGMFLEFGTDALSFQVLWDDRERLYGDMQSFHLLYYLADDTVEIMRASSKNDGRESFPKLLKRSKLPKDGKVALESDCYTWKDLAIGQTVNVFGRTMLIAGCDAFTRQYYLSHDISLNDDMSVKVVPEKKVEIKRVIPPYNGFGSEEDSLRSCSTQLAAPPPKKDIKHGKSGMILSFNAQLVSDKEDDKDRRFVFQFFLEDDTIAIREPPVRNSGIMGGKFLRRQRMKHDNGSYYAANDMYIGNLLDILGHHFLLLDSDEYTYRLMDTDDRAFPFNDFARLREILTSKKQEIKAYFVAADYDGNGVLDQERLAKCCNKIGMKFNKQEINTIWRRLNPKGKESVVFTKLIKMAEEGNVQLR